MTIPVKRNFWVRPSTKLAQLKLSKNSVNKFNSLPFLPKFWFPTITYIIPKKRQKKQRDHGSLPNCPNKSYLETNSSTKRSTNYAALPFILSRRQSCWVQVQVGVGPIKILISHIFVYSLKNACLALAAPFLNFLVKWYFFLLNLRLKKSPTTEFQICSYYLPAHTWKIVYR